MDGRGQGQDRGCGQDAGVGRTQARGGHDADEVGGRTQAWAGTWT